MGAQHIQIFGIDPASRTAGVLVAADYHMKLIGMGLADGVAGVESYLATVPIRNGKPAVPMTVMRWWFAMHYQPVRTTPEGTAYEIRGQGPCVLSETELLTQRGERVHTGKSEPLTARFAHDFTAHFRLLCQRYPLYGELRNVFDLALVAAIIVAEDLPARVGWQPGLLLDDQRLALPTYSVPREVHTVANHRVVNRRHIVAGVSGGVMIAPQDVLKTARDGRRYGEIIDRHYGVPDELAATAWWWDAP